MSVYIHPTAEVSAEAIIGEGTRIWHQAQIRQGARIGNECILGKGVYIDFEVVIGHRCKLQNGVYVYHGATVEEGVFLGPGVMVLNDKNPRAITPAGALKSDADWEVSPTHIGYGAGIGGGAIILPGVTIGKWAIIGSGAVVTRNIPDYGLAYGNPARLAGFVCPCGQRLIPSATTSTIPENQDLISLSCPKCQQAVTIPAAIYRQAL